MFCPTDVNGTTLKHCGANQTGAQVGVAAEYGPRHRTPPWTQKKAIQGPNILFTRTMT